MFDLEPQEARLLLDVAFMATGQNRFETANRILAALKAYRPQSESLAVAETVLLLSRGALEEAVYQIERELLRFPDSAMLKVFKGLALLKADRLQEAHEILTVVVSSGGDPVAVQMAKDLLA